MGTLEGSMHRPLGLKIAILLLFALGSSTFLIQASAEENNPAEGQTIHVLVGKSVVMNVQAPMTRVLSSNPAVVETLAISPNQVVIEGKSAGASTLILWDSAGHSQVLDVVVDIDIAGLRDAIQHSFPKEQLQVQADGAHLILTGAVSDPHIVDSLTKMAGTYSTQVVNSVNIETVHQPQVMLEVKFAEVDRTKLTQFGVNLLSTGAGNTIGTTTTGQFGSFGTQHITDTFGVPASPKPNVPVPTSGPNQETFKTDQTISQLLNIFLFRPDIHFGAVVQALQQRNVLQILAEPNLMAMNGEKASFLAGGEFPFPVVQGGANVGAVTIQFRPFGVRLDFVGNIGADNVIRLQVAPEVSTLDFTNALVISGFTVPAISTRRAETEIELKDGQSFGIAGLLDNRTTVQLSKVPGIGDIPILGELFRSRSINRSNAELMVLVTPHIIDPVRKITTPPAMPKPITPYLDNKDFDQNVPGHKDVETTAPAPSSK
jgi:pilus assembly protein CpaC